MLRKIKKIFKYKPFEILELAVLSFFLVVAHLYLKCSSAEKILRFLKSLDHSPKNLKWPEPRLHQFISLLETADRNLGRPSCLRKALALAFLFRLTGFPAELRIGITRENQTLKAHAWLERKGVRLETLFDPSFQTLQPLS